MTKVKMKDHVYSESYIILIPNELYIFELENGEKSYRICNRIIKGFETLFSIMHTKQLDFDKWFSLLSNAEKDDYIWDM